VVARTDRFAPTDDNRERLFAAFEAAMTTGDLTSFAQLLAEDAVLYADGGGRCAAVLEPVQGKHSILSLNARDTEHVTGRAAASSRR
jgi:RNA polymerase sigma-70 factor, ECF subfamily